MSTNLRILLVVVAIAGVAGGVALDRMLAGGNPEPLSAGLDIEHARKHLDPTFVCPMHPEIHSKEQGNCPICGMKLVEVKQDQASDDNGTPVVTISPDVMNNFGVQTVPVVRKTIMRRVETPGFIQQIRKGEQTQIRAPFKGVVSKFLFTGEDWFEAGTPLLEMDSDELLQAQHRHIELLELNLQEGGENSAAVTALQPPAAEQSAEQLPADDAADDMDDEPTEGEAVINAEQRQKLYSMGLNDQAIDEMERAMIADMKAGMAGKSGDSEELKQSADRFASLLGKTPAGGDLADAQSTSDESAAGEYKPAEVPEAVEQNKAAAVVPQEPVQTLDDSRRRLYKLGMRPEDIQSLEQNRNPTSQLVIYASKPGKIMDLRVKEGDEVEAGTFLFRIGGQVRVTVLANAFQRDAAWISTGMRAEITMPHVSGKVWPGIVNDGAISINPNSQNIGIKLGFSAPFDKVRQNLYVVGTVYGKASENVLSVPVDAVIRTEGQGRVILSLGEGRFRPVQVTTGIAGNGDIEITDGLQEGDQVVARGQFLIDSESSLQADFRRLGSE